jgi:hypothetical protein
LAEIGDLSRFQPPRELMGYLGLVPSESSTGDTVNRGGITKAGNGRARRTGHFRRIHVIHDGLYPGLTAHHPGRHRSESQPSSRTEGKPAEHGKKMIWSAVRGRLWRLKDAGKNDNRFWEREKRGHFWG